MALELVFLGTGTSAGVPMIGCDCDVCRSTDPRDRRDRASVLIRYPRSSDRQAPASTSRDNPIQVLIDTSPELRSQMVRHEVMAIDGVCYTHNHADHIFGIDDLRRFNAVMGTSIDLYAEPRVCDWFRRTFEYIFDAKKNINKSFVPQLILRDIEPEVAFDLHGARWTPLRLMHGRLPILGFRVDWAGQSLAYCTDVSSVPPETYPLLEGLDVLVLDGLRYRHHPTHLTVDQALAVMDEVKPARGYLTHIAHDIRHADLEPKLPEHVFLAFDGLTVGLGE